MRCFNRLFIWENNKYFRILQAYRKDVIEYFKNTKFSWYSDPVENDSAIELREKINMSAYSVIIALETAKVNPVVTYTPPPMVGGVTKHIDVVKNIFILHSFRMDSEDILDFIDQAIGVYRTDRKKSLIRTINPFYWLTFILIEVIKIPFFILGTVGFDQNRLESSMIGRLFKGIALIVGLYSFFGLSYQL